jgi:hypothetical protein
MAPHNVDRNGEAGEHWQQKELGQQRMGRNGSRSPPKVVLQTKEMITKQAGKIAKRADEHEAFITKVLSLSRSCTFSLTQYGSVPVMPKGCSFVHCLV